MHSTLKKFELIQNKINEIITVKQLKTKPTIIVVSKTFPIDNVISLLDFGHLHYGENKLQEAIDKWRDVKYKYKNVKLHMVGRLQSNKAKKAVELFDYIHSLDSKRLALKIFQYQKELKKEVKLFIQVNIGDEKQKSGISLNELDSFYNYCTKELSLKIIGLMCLPPVSPSSLEFFKELKRNSDRLNLTELSMGMSRDFEEAILTGSTFLRLGTLVMGKRNLHN